MIELLFFHWHHLHGNLFFSVHFYGKNTFREEARGRIFAGLKIGANMGIDVIIPVYRPDKKFDKLFAALLAQTVKPDLLSGAACLAYESAQPSSFTAKSRRSIR